MTSTLDQADDSTQPPVDARAASSVHGEAQPRKPLARRIAGFASNLLATGLILLMAVVVGRQAHEWWGAKPPGEDAIDHTAEVLGAGGVADPSLPQQLQFGESPLALRRTQFEGDLNAALATLRRDCRAAAERASGPLGPAGPAERNLLQLVAKQPPSDRRYFAANPDELQVFEHLGPIPLVVAVRRFAGTAAVANKDGAAPPAEIGDSERRVVSWGMALHLAGTRWTLFTLEASGGRPAHSTASMPLALRTLPLPSNSRRQVSLEARGGDSLLSFAGAGQPAAWRDFYDDYFAEQGWTPAEWRSGESTWHARFTAPSGDWVDVQIVEQSPGTLSGIISRGAPAEDKSHDD